MFADVHLPTDELSGALGASAAAAAAGAGGGAGAPASLLSSSSIIGAGPQTGSPDKEAQSSVSLSSSAKSSVAQPQQTAATAAAVSAALPAATTATTVPSTTAAATQQASSTVGAVAGQTQAPGGPVERSNSAVSDASKSGDMVVSSVTPKRFRSCIRFEGVCRTILTLFYRRNCKSM